MAESSTLVSEYFIYYASLIIDSELELEEIGRLIAERIAPGSEFGGKDEAVLDEVPAIFIKGVLGCRILLGGGDGEYALTITQRAFVFLGPPEFNPRFEIVDFSPSVALLLEGLPGMKVSAPGVPEDARILRS